MSDFDLDLRAMEEHIEDGDTDVVDADVVLDVLDGTTPDEERIETVSDGSVLLLDVDGDVNELASGFAREVSEAGGNLVHFRGFLVVTPPGVSVDNSRL
ncbi:hypothetical protein Halru_1113 [Halovivax ruber XH-70]|uniref:Uncharacterized protein n=2 Tax=Halovivax TaxID=332951 RepID=L0I808_HALRX|nr:MULTISPECIES: DUF5779 family protein [Halovivax]AGB15730.1 hypothetical protein Halru_1113 [Halovivax ruber XH-70]ELZ13784.1 hypothetical protein C479_03026 [Halovivax asiaticus JCM 14624]